MGGLEREKKKGMSTRETHKRRCKEGLWVVSGNRGITTQGLRACKDTPSQVVRGEKKSQTKRKKKASGILKKKNASEERVPAP